jgi:ferrous iron transport protein A
MVKLGPTENNSCTQCDLPSSAECSLTPLCKVGIGKKVKVACVHGERGLCARMAALGIYPGAEMDLVCSGCVRVNGGVLSLGEDISKKILVTSSV